MSVNLGLLPFLLGVAAIEIETAVLLLTAAQLHVERSRRLLFRLGIVLAIPHEDFRCGGQHNQIPVNVAAVAVGIERAKESNAGEADVSLKRAAHDAAVGGQ